MKINVDGLEIETEREEHPYNCKECSPITDYIKTLDEDQKDKLLHLVT